jgi:hypothetical protein
MKVYILFALLFTFGLKTNHTTLPMKANLMKLLIKYPEWLIATQEVSMKEEIISTK